MQHILSGFVSIFKGTLNEKKNDSGYEKGQVWKMKPVSLEEGFWGGQISKDWGEAPSFSSNLVQIQNSRLSGFIVQPWPVSYPGYCHQAI